MTIAYVVIRNNILVSKKDTFKTSVNNVLEAAKEYVTINGSASGRFKYNTNVTIKPTVPASTTGNWSNTGACTSSIVNQKRTKTTTNYSFSKWNDDNIASSRTITVTGNATYTATINSSSSTQTQTCTKVATTGTKITCGCSGEAYFTARCSDYGMADSPGKWGCWGIEGNGSANVNAKFWITDPKCPSGEHLWGNEDPQY